MPIERPWLIGQRVRLTNSRSQFRTRDVAEFLLIQVLVIIFLIVVYRAASCGVLVSVCEVKLILCVELILSMLFEI